MRWIFLLLVIPGVLFAQDANKFLRHVRKVAAATTPQYNIAVTTPANCTITPSGGVLLDSNATQTFTITAAASYTVDSLQVDGTLVDSTTSYTFDSVSASHTLRAFVHYSAAGTTYYVSSSGSDSNSGTHPDTAWKTPDKIRAHASFLPNDSVLFKRGDTLQGEFSKTYSGLEGAPIVLGAYGSGVRPIIYGDLTGCEWTAVAGRDSMYKTWAGNAVGLVGYEYYSGAWHAMTVVENEAMYYLSNADSLTKYLNLFTASDVGPFGTWDTIYVKTATGVAPVVKVLREGNVVNGAYVTVRDLDLRNYVSAITSYNSSHMIWRRLYTRNTIMHTFLLSRCQDMLQDSCRIDSTSATAWFDFYGSRNMIRVCSTYAVTDSSMGLPSYYPEKCVIGMQTDTACAAEYIIADDLIDGFFDSGEVSPSSYAYNDTIRYCTITNARNGFFPAGNAWAIHNNTISISGTDKRGLQLNIQGSGNTAIFGNKFVMDDIAGIGIYIPDRGSHTGTATITRDTVQGALASVYFVNYDSPGITSDSNYFCGDGVFATGDYPSYTEYDSLAMFQDSTTYETNSTYAASCSAAPVPDTLINFSPATLNGGFESFAANDPWPWNKIVTGSSTIIDTTEIHGGSHAARMSRIGSGVCALNTAAILTDGKTYDITFWARTTTGTATVRVQVDGTVYNKTASITDTWTEFSIADMLCGNTTTELTISNITNDSIVILDDVLFIEDP